MNSHCDNDNDNVAYLKVERILTAFFLILRNACARCFFFMCVNLRMADGKRKFVDFFFFGGMLIIE